jgi:hypothetical protein
MWEKGETMRMFSESCSCLLSLFENELCSLFSDGVVSEPWVLFPDVEPLSVLMFDLEDLASGRDK